MLDRSDRLDEHLSNPRNAGVLAEANAIGFVGAMRWGDAIRLMLRIDPDTDVIEQARFQAFGCSTSIASSSAVTEMVTGKSTEEALRVTPDDIADFLGGLPPRSMYCATMSCEALQLAIATYRGTASEGNGAEAALLCNCFGVREDVVERVIRINGLTDPEQVTHHTKAGGCCITCFRQIERVLARVNSAMASEGLMAAAHVYRIGSADPIVLEVTPRGETATRPKAPAIGAIAARPAPRPAPPRPASGPAAPVARRGSPEQIRVIEHAIDELRPHLQRDGGDCELVDVDGNTVLIRLSGACAGCQLASVTLSGVQARLADKLGLPLRVVPVQ